MELTSGKFVMLDWNPEYGFSLECIDANGIHLWNRTVDLPSCDYLNLVACNEGGFALSGSADSAILAAVFNGIPQSESIPIEIVVIGGIGLILAAVVIIFVKRPSLAK